MTLTIFIGGGGGLDYFEKKSNFEPNKNRHGQKKYGWIFHPLALLNNVDFQIIFRLPAVEKKIFLIIKSQAPPLKKKMVCA